MKKVLNIYKPLGKSPLEAINLFREQNPKYKDVKLGYAGRLDPMAEGVLLVLVGEELKEQKKYWGLDKEYEAEILLGFETDTYDILGIPRMSQITNNKQQITNKSQNLNAKIKNALKDFEGEFTFTYPPYSSRTVEGKPLFWWARRNKLSEIKLPQKTTEIKKVDLLEIKGIAKQELENLIIERINLVKGDFRQKLIKTTWKSNLRKTKCQEFVIIKIRVLVSSGTYIRTIAQKLGTALGTGAVLLHLKRTKVEKFSVKNSIKLKKQNEI